MKNKRNIIIAILILAALLIYPFRGQIKEAFSGGTGAAPEAQLTVQRPDISSSF